MNTKELWHTKCVLDGRIQFLIDINRVMFPPNHKMFNDPMYTKLLNIVKIMEKPENQLVAIHDCYVIKNNKLRIARMKHNQKIENLKETY